jgi:hypothetical protein
MPSRQADSRQRFGRRLEHKQKLFGMSKRGNIYLRRMLIHGARAVLFRVKYDTAGLGQWVRRLSQRAPRNKVVVAIANKPARIAWAVLSSGRDCRWKAQPLSTFPPPRRRLDRIPPRSAEERRKTKQQSNGVPENLNAQMRRDRGI